MSHPEMPRSLAVPSAVGLRTTSYWLHAVLQEAEVVIGVGTRSTELEIECSSGATCISASLLSL